MTHDPRSLVRRTRAPQSTSRPVASPIHTSVVYASGDADQLDAQYEGRIDGYTYSREGHPNATIVGEKIDWLEGVAPEWGKGVVTGSGMGATLNTGVGLNAYVLTDRATWITFANKQDATILFEGDPTLFNQYGVIPVSKDRCPSVNRDGAETFTRWLLSDTGQAAIADYRVDGKQLFFPNADKSSS